jgi:hypothetical protein
LVALSTIVSSQPVDNFEAGQPVEAIPPQVADAIDNSEDQVGAESRFGYGGYGGYGRGWGGHHRGYGKIFDLDFHKNILIFESSSGGWGGHRGYGGYGGYGGKTDLLN